MAIGEQTIVPDALEAIRQGMQQKPADELLESRGLYEVADGSPEKCEGLGRPHINRIELKR
jgi:hypothetical protein